MLHSAAQAPRPRSRRRTGSRRGPPRPAHGLERGIRRSGSQPARSSRATGRSRRGARVPQRDQRRAPVRSVAALRTRSISDENRTAEWCRGDRRVSDPDGDPLSRLQDLSELVWNLPGPSRHTRMLRREASSEERGQDVGRRAARLPHSRRSFDRLIEVGGRLLRESPDFKDFLSSLQ
jgi:hypothetical protein